MSVDTTHREVCCLPGAQVRDNSRKLHSLIRSSDYFSLLIVQASSDELAERSLGTIKKDFRGLEQLADAMGVRVIFSPLQWQGQILKGAGKPILLTHG